MENRTKFKILKPAHDVFEAFVDPVKISGFWFSASSARWQEGQAVVLKFEEYHAELEIQVVKIIPDELICFTWGPADDVHTVTISLQQLPDGVTLIQIAEEGFKADDANLLQKMLDNKSGWVFVLTCLKAYLEFGVTKLRTGLVNE